MKLNPDQFTLDYENYRGDHGPSALFPYYSKTNGKLYIVKEQTANAVTLSEVSDGAEIVVPTEEFSASYLMWIQDEAVFVFGTKERQAAAHAQLEWVSEAINRVLYGNARQLPAVV